MRNARRLGPAAAHERFEHAVEGTPDPAFTEEARIVGELRDRADSVELSTVSRARIAAELRQQLESAAKPEPADATGSTAGERTARTRVGIALGAACCLLLVCGALGMLVAKDALPGQTFYGVKRGMEAASVQLTTDKAAQARKQLDYASARMASLRTLAERTETGRESYRTALEDLDEQTAEGARAGIRIGTNGEGATLTTLSRWVDHTSGELRGVRTALPAAVRPRADRSIAMLHRIGERVAALTARLGCPQITSGRTDQIGLLPATGRCSGRAKRAETAPPTEHAQPPPATHRPREHAADLRVRAPRGSRPSTPEPTPKLPAAPRTDRFGPAPSPAEASKPKLPKPPPVRRTQQNIDPNPLLGGATRVLTG